MRCSKIMKRQKKGGKQYEFTSSIIVIASVIGAGAILIYVLRKLFNK